MLPRNGLYVVAFGDSPRGCPKLGPEALVPVLRQRSCVAVTETTALPGPFLRDRWRAVSATGSWCRPRLKHLKGSQHHFAELDSRTDASIGTNDYPIPQTRTRTDIDTGVLPQCSVQGPLPWIR